jgi:predicted RNA-binding protein
LEIRGDWYRGADLMARLIDQSRCGGPILAGFPAQWLPLFAHFDARWVDPTPPPTFIPIVSGLSIEQLLGLMQAAQSEGQSRVLVEAIAALDPLIADVLYKLDRRIKAPIDLKFTQIPLTGWQSYGRPELLDLEDRILANAATNARSAVLLPCARKRPYRASRTHARLWRGVSQIRQEATDVDEIVVSSLGVVPAAFWGDPVVLAYDSGVPDIYRVLRLMRSYFQIARYDEVIDCLEFEPYRDCLRIIQREGLVGAITDGPGRRVRKLPRP